MFIYDQAPLKNAAERKKQLYVTWFAEDRPMAEPVIRALSERGTATVLMERSAEICRHDDYIQKATDRIGTCNVGLVMLSKAVFDPANAELQQIMWYEVGFMMSLGIRLVLFFLDIEPKDRNDYLSRTPVRQVQGTDSIEQLLEVIEANEVQEKVFYADPELNRYASRRINYYRLTTLFNIYRKDMDAIYEDIYDPDDDEDDDEDDARDAGSGEEAKQKAKMQLLTEMLAELNCGCTILSFNDRRGLNGELEPYYPEIDTIIRDYPIHQDYSKPKLMNQDASPDIYATVQAEFIIPVHALLGVTFKPFMAINKISRFRPRHIERIIRSNAKAGGEGTGDPDIVLIKKEKEQRLYFLLEMYAMDSWEGLEQYGKRLNHVWPQ